MLITLKKDHKHYDYAKKNKIAVAHEDCATRDCFHLHRFVDRAQSGKLNITWKCARRDAYGCPEISKGESK